MYIHRERRVSGRTCVLAAQIDCELSEARPGARRETVNPALEGGAANDPVPKFRVAAFFPRCEEVGTPDIACHTGYAACGDAFIHAAATGCHIIAKPQIIAWRIIHTFEDGVGAASQTRPCRYRAHATIDHNRGDKRGRRIMENRVHQIGPTRGKALAINAQVEALTEQPAILHLPGELTIADPRAPWRAGGQIGDVAALQGGGFRGYRGFRRCIDPCPGNYDDVLQGRRGLLCEGWRAKGNERRAGQEAAGKFRVHVFGLTN